MSDNKSYGNVFKTTFLFGFVQVYRALIMMVKHKVAAILIGPEGIGVLGIFNTTLGLIQTGAGLGISQSAVRDVAEANATNDVSRFSKIITITNKVILFTGLLGCVITLILSYWLSFWTFGDNTHIIAYCILSLAIAFNIINDSRLAILKGTRQLYSLAKANVIGVTSGAVVSLPLYYFFGIKGIVPELLIASIVTVLVSNYFVNKINYIKQPLSFKEILKEASPMVKMGMALMAVSFLQMAVSFVINAYIRHKGGLADVGLYSAGSYILNGYFGIIITALMTDYYPRIAAVNKDNMKLQQELNKQSLVSILLCCPMFVLFLVLMPYFIKLLYSTEFLPAVDFIKWSIFWTLITVCSNQVDLILVAKFQTKLYMAISVLFRMIQVILCILLYNYLGLEGLGISYFILGILHISVMCFVVFRYHRIRFDDFFIKVSMVELALVITSVLIQNKFNGYMNYLLSLIVFIITCSLTIYVMKKHLNLNIIEFIKNKLKL